MTSPAMSSERTDVSAIADLLCPPLPIDDNYLPMDPAEHLRKPPHLLRPFIIGMLLLTCVLPLYALLLLTVPVWSNTIGVWIGAYSETLKAQREASYAALLICQSIFLALFVGMLFAPTFQLKVPSGLHGELIVSRMRELSAQHARRQSIALIFVLISMMLVVYSAVGVLGTDKVLRVYGWALSQSTTGNLAQFAWEPWIHPNYFFGHLIVLVVALIVIVSFGMRPTDRLSDQLDRLARLNTLRSDIVKDTEVARVHASWGLWAAVGVCAVSGAILVVTIENWIFIVLYAAAFILVALCSSYAGQLRMWGTQDRRVVYGTVLTIQIIVLVVLLVSVSSIVAQRGSTLLVLCVLGAALIHFGTLLWLAAIRPLRRGADTQLEREAHLVESVRAYRRERAALEGYLRVADEEALHVLVSAEAALEAHAPVYRAPRAGVPAAAL